jgi:uncharacterized protein (DUF1697 family)
MSVKDRRVALLRGINVGTAKRVAMADLRQLVEELGHADVRTLLNSGNVVYTVTRKQTGDEALALETAIAKRLGVRTKVIVLAGREVSAAVRENPLTPVAHDPARLLLLALKDPAAAGRLKPLLAQPWTPEAVAMGKRVAYLWCANGIAVSPLWAEINRTVGEGGTARNLTTMTKLVALVEGS